MRHVFVAASFHSWKVLKINKILQSKSKLGKENKKQEGLVNGVVSPISIMDIKKKLRNKVKMIKKSNYHDTKVSEYIHKWNFAF